MDYNKIIVNGKTVLDLTEDSVTADTLAQGCSAHDAAGNQIIGTAFGATLTAEETEDGVTFTATDKNGTMSAAVKNGKSAYAYAQNGGYTGTEAEFAQKLAKAVPTALPASDVYSWAKQPTKPTYTAAEIGAATEAYVDAKLAERAELGGGSGTSAYTNQLPLATDTDRKTVYDGDGYIDGYRLSSSGGISTQDGMSATGFIAATPGQTIRIKGATPMQGKNNYIIAYKADNTVSKYASMAYDSTGWITPDDGWMKYEDGVIIIPLTGTMFGTDFNAVRFCSAQLSDDVIVTVDEIIAEGGGTGSGGATASVDTLKRMREWDKPVYTANIPLFTLETEKPAYTNAAFTPSGAYARYDALMAKHPHYITKTDLGLCSDGTNHVYRYDFREPEPHHQDGQEWSETKAKAIILSGIHFEWAGVYALYCALEEIAENPDLRDFRRNTHLIVIPCANPYALIASNDAVSMGVRNANGVEIHRNFEVGFLYPGDSGYVDASGKHHGGTEPLSEVETQYIDEVIRNNSDAALFLSCHNFDADANWGTGFIWPSTATAYMCNMGYRLIDKMSTSWMGRYGTELAAGIADYRADALAEWDNRFGFAHVSGTPGTEARQAAKYGVQGANVEVSYRFFAHGTKASPEPVLSSFTMSRGAEVYVNFLLMTFGCYDPKDKKEYYLG